MIWIESDNHWRINTEVNSVMPSFIFVSIFSESKIRLSPTDLYMGVCQIEWVSTIGPMTF